MGSDGGIQIVKRTDWDEQNFGIDPEEIGLTAENMIGIPVVFGYMGTNVGGISYATKEDMGEGWESFYSYSQEHILTPIQEKKLTAFRWFDNHCEYHELWT